MIILDTQTKSLEVDLAGAVNSVELDWVVSWTDHTSTTFVPDADDGTTNGAAAVEMVAAPGASTQRQIKYFSIYNADDQANTVIVHVNNNGTIRLILKFTLAIRDTLVYTDGHGFQVLDSNGQVKSTPVDLSPYAVKADNEGITGDWTFSGTTIFTADATFNDNISALFGSAGDAAIYYDATELIIDTQVVGGGDLRIEGGNLVAGGTGPHGFGTATPDPNHIVEMYKAGGASVEFGLMLVGGAGNEEAIINFGDSLVGAARYQGRITFRHADNSMRFWTDSGVRGGDLVIDSSGDSHFGGYVEAGGVEGVDSSIFAGRFPDNDGIHFAASHDDGVVVQDGESMTFVMKTGALFTVSNDSTGQGAAFFADFVAAAITKISDPSAGFDVTDVDNNKIAVFKAAGSSTVTIKNYQGGARTLFVAILGHVASVTAPA